MEKIGFELIGIGVMLLSPVYGALWFLVQTATKNKEAIANTEKTIFNLNIRINSLIEDMKNCDVCESRKILNKFGEDHAN